MRRLSLRAARDGDQSVAVLLAEVGNAIPERAVHRAPLVADQVSQVVGFFGHAILHRDGRSGAALLSMEPSYVLRDMGTGSVKIWLNAGFRSDRVLARSPAPHVEHQRFPGEWGSARRRN